MVLRQRRQGSGDSFQVLVRWKVIPRLAAAGPAVLSLAAGCRACLWCRLAEQAGERGDCFEQQRVETGLLVGGVAGAELGDRAAVLGLGGELACPGRDGGGHDGGRRGCRGFWPGMVSPG